jgi:drug/metabolite transporter (DMT)-like permease
VIYGQLATQYLRPTTWALGLIGSPALVLAWRTWHTWQTRRHPARFSDDSPLNFVLGILLFVALYFTWWYAPALSVTSDAALIYFGGTMLLTALRGDAGCKILTPSSWLLRRHDQSACALFASIDAPERRCARP